MGIAAFKNGLRLHFDSLSLFNAKSYPSSLQLSIISIEEFGKYFALSNYVFYSKNSSRLEALKEIQFIQELYRHPFKQKWFFHYDFSNGQEFISKIEAGELERLKQNATYVGFSRLKKGINFKRPFVNPCSLKRDQARDQIVTVNNFLINLIDNIQNGISELDELAVNKVLTIALKENLVNGAKENLTSRST